MPLLIQKLTVSPLQENCYVIGDDASREGIVIDPGDEPRRIVQAVERLGLTVKKIVNTHGHVDHIAAAEDVKEALGATLHLHPGDEMYLPNTVENAHLFGLGAGRIPRIDSFLSDGMQIPLGTLTLSVHHCPGHSPGHCLLRVDDDVFCGDLVFAGSIGRTDLPGGDYGTIVDSLERLILTLADEVRLHPGHGPSTTVAVERKFNPFLQGLRPRENRSGPM